MPIQEARRDDRALALLLYLLTLTLIGLPGSTAAQGDRAPRGDFSDFLVSRDVVFQGTLVSKEYLKRALTAFVELDAEFDVERTKQLIGNESGQ